MKLVNPPDGRPWALLVLAGTSLLANVILGAMLYRERADASALPPAAGSVATALVEAAPTALDPAAAEPVEAVAAVAIAEPAPVQAPPGAVPEAELLRVQADVTHSLARTFQGAVPEHADVLSAVYARLFVWDLDLRRDLQRGDALSVAYAWDGELAHIPVATYTSGKLGTTLRAYRYQPEGDAYPSWWTADGQEVPRRLVDDPLQGRYEQITSLLKDRPTHKGMDFKVPEGTPVVSPRGGTVVRTDWNLAYNGNCAEVRFDDGTVARFLHLSKTSVKAGQRLGKGEVVGLSGNTGRSTAPHLHYELERGGKIVDPVDYHGVVRRTLPEAELGAFRAVVAYYDRVIDAGT